MKKLSPQKRFVISVIFVLSLSTCVKAQTPCDSVAIEYRANILNIQTNFVKSNQEFEVGCGLVCAGAFVHLIGYMGSSTDFVMPQQKRQFYIAATVTELLGVCVVFYSHTFIKKGSVKVRPNKITYSF